METYPSTTQRMERVNFACKNREINCNQVIFCGLEKFRNVQIWGSLDQSGPLKMRFAIGQFTDEQNVQILNDIILPLHNANTNNYIILQVNEIFNFAITIN